MVIKVWRTKPLLGPCCESIVLPKGGRTIYSLCCELTPPPQCLTIKISFKLKGLSGRIRIIMHRNGREERKAGVERGGGEGEVQPPYCIHDSFGCPHRKLWRYNVL